MHAPTYFAFAPASRKHGAGPVLAPSKPRLQLPRSSEFHGLRAKQKESDTEVVEEASLSCPTDAFFSNGRTIKKAGRLRDPAQSIACKDLPIPPPLPPFALLRFVRRAAVPERQSVEERENVPPGCQNRPLFHRKINLFFVLRNYYLKRSNFCGPLAICMDFIRTCKQVLRLFVVGMCRTSGASRSPFLCPCSPCTQPDFAAKLSGIDPAASACP